jgi:hypothetical protein
MMWQSSHIGGMASNIIIKTSEVKRLSGLQCSAEEIAHYFGITIAKWRQVLKDDDVVREAFEHGQAGGKISLRRKQFLLASDNAAMAIHLGKQYLGQVDKSKLEVSGPNGGPVETFDYSKLSDEDRKALRKTLTKAVR